MELQYQETMVKDLVHAFEGVARLCGLKATRPLVAEHLTRLIQLGQLSKDDGLRLAAEVDRELAPEEERHLSRFEAEDELRIALYPEGPRSFLRRVEALRRKRWFELPRQIWPEQVAVWVKQERFTGPEIDQFIGLLVQLTTGNHRKTKPLVTLNEVLALLQGGKV